LDGRGKNLSGIKGFQNAKGRNGRRFKVPPP